MRILRNILIASGAIILILVLIAFFLPKTYEIKREITIGSPLELVFEQVADFNNCLLWNPWSESDPKAINTISGETGMPGMKWEWDGKKVGKGSLTLLELHENEWIINKLHFQYPNQMESLDMWFFRETGGMTHVEWRNSGDLWFPIGRWFGFFMDGFMGKNFEKGLENLKSRCEEISAK